MTHDAKFWDRIAERYFANPIKNLDAYEHKLEMTQALMRPDMTVLEFGCGTGGTALRHAPHVQHILATDISEAMLDIARREATAADVSNVEFSRADIAAFDMRPAGYDMVLGMSILHLVENPAEIIRKVYDGLKPGGYFVSSTACLGDRMGWFRYVGPIGKAFGKLPYVKVFTTDDLLADLTQAGFTIDTHWRPDGEHAVFLIAKKPMASD